MNKTRNYFLKVFLIIMAIFLAVGAVLFFLKTRVQPPRKLTYINQYTEDINRASKIIANANEQVLEHDFQLILNRIDLLKQENLISEDERISNIVIFVNAYIPAFRNWCDQCFNMPVWSTETITFMNKRVKEVKDFNTAYGNASIISSENMVKLNEVDNTLKKYNEAWKLCNANIKKSSDSRNNLNKANQFKHDAYLSKCTALMDALNSLPTKYQKSHYNNVNSKVKKLSMIYFSSASQIDEWAEKYKAAKAAINDYNSVASSLYGISTCDFDINSYFTQAKNVFRNKISEWDPAYIRNSYEQTFGVRIY